MPMPFFVPNCSRPSRAGFVSCLAAIASISAACVSSSTAPAAEPAASKPAAESPHPSKAGIEFFEKKIRPILVGKCYQCHSAAATSLKGGLLLDTREGLLKGGESGAAIVPGDSQASLLMESLRFEGLEMPPTGKLTDEQIADFAAWIDMGAPDPRTKSAVAKKGLNVAQARQFWAFQPPKPVPPPATSSAAWPASDIDRYLLASMERAGLSPSADADKATWLRRVTFDLVGLPPTYAEVESFLSDASPEAYARVVDRLLASPQFGERWGRHWLDVARYGESTGKERNVVYPQAWRYRDWVVDAFNADKPYTDFILEQTAGDLLPAADAARRNANLVATGFLALGPKGLNDRNLEQYLMDIVDEQIDVVTRGFLATTVGCARCHDHKFDPIPQTDYYALAGIFRSTETLSGVRSRAQGANRDYVGGYMPLVDASAAATASPSTSQAADPAARLSAQGRREYDALRERLSERKRELARVETALKKKTTDKAKANKDYKQLTSQIASLESKLKKMVNGATVADAPEPTSVAMGVRDVAEPRDTEVRVRGEPSEKGPVVPRGFVTVLKTPRTPSIDPSRSGRLELARWIAARDNPLTARVAANRIWSHLFGRGLVATTDNFGALGEEPTHPELLDHLALRFMDGGWSTKGLIREIALSRAYRMSSAHRPDAYEKDPANRNYWRMDRRRLDAESIRDAILATAGTLDLNRPQGTQLTGVGASGEIRRNNAFDPNDAAAKPCRSLYLPIVRNGLPDVL